MKLRPDSDAGARALGMDLSPDLRRPLSLWNPLDYLKLLYWIFFFPQALRGYEEQWVTADIRGAKATELWKVLRSDRTLRHLIWMSLALIGVVPSVIGLGAEALSLPWDWFGVAFGVAGGVAVGVAGGVDAAIVGLSTGAAWSLAAGLMGLRVPDTVLSRLIGRRSFISRTTILKDSRFTGDLHAAFEESWSRGLDASRHLLSWTLQFRVVVSEINRRLEASEPEQVLSRVARLPNGAYASVLLRFGSVDLRNVLIHAGIDGGYLLVWRKSWRESLKTRFPDSPRLDTAARAACAGFHFWDSIELESAQGAFSKVRHLPHGEELVTSAEALAKSAKIESLEDLATWTAPTYRLEDGHTEFLRPGVVQAMGHLGQASRAVVAMRSAHSHRARQDALAQAVGHLQTLLDEGPSTCEWPEWPIIHGIAETWRDLVGRAVAQVAEAASRRPVENPFVGYSGRPVRGSAFVGRVGALSKIERYLSAPNPPALFVYGHRRMGKTSILLNLDAHLGDDVLLVYLDMQGLIQQADRPGDLLFDICRALTRRLTKAELGPVDEPMSEEFATSGAAWRRFADLLRDLEPVLGEKRLVLAFDEFEYLEQGLSDERLDRDLLQSLRSLQNELPWLALVFGGLHTLDEMSRDYWFPFFSQSENIPVSYLSRDDTRELLAHPSDDFNVAFEDDLVDELYRLTYGQPYLLQRLAWELVEQWNQDFLAASEPLPRLLRRGALDDLLDDDFFSAASYYFDGVWNQLDEEEQVLVQRLAERPDPWPAPELQAQAGRLDLSATLERLSRRDVILVDGDGAVRFAAELLRRWLCLSGR